VHVTAQVSSRNVIVISLFIRAREEEPIWV